MDLEGRKPDIEYPCDWAYTIIGSDEERLQLAAATAVGEVDHELDFSHRSSKGQYVSMKLKVTVESEAHRLDLLQTLSEHADVRFVL